MELQAACDAGAITASLSATYQQWRTYSATWIEKGGWRARWVHSKHTIVHLHPLGDLLHWRQHSSHNFDSSQTKSPTHTHIHTCSGCLSILLRWIIIWLEIWCGPMGCFEARKWTWRFYLSFLSREEWWWRFWKLLQTSGLFVGGISERWE